jgi:hypothetical protein
MAQLTTVATGNAAHSTSRFSQSNTQLTAELAELASLSPEMIAEDATAREEMLNENCNNVLEWLLLSPQVIKILCPIFYPIIFIQQLTIFLFISTYGHI